MQVPVVTRTSHATRPVGSSARTASRTASEIWSAILSGWPSVTDSDVNRYSLPAHWRLMADGFSSGRVCRKYKAYGQVTATCLANWSSRPIYLAFKYRPYSAIFVLRQRAGDRKSVV